MNDANIPAEIMRLDFSKLGCHWLAPDTRKLHPYALAERPECHKRLARFIQRYEFNPLRHCYRNLFILFQKGGASKKAVKDVLEHYFHSAHQVLGDAYGMGSAFDHVEMWGRDGKPVCLIGHPYQVMGEAFETLAAIRDLGMHVTVTGNGWYGYSTVQVCVHYGVLAKPTIPLRDPHRPSADNNGDRLHDEANYD